MRTSTDTTPGTALQARALGLLTDGHVWSRSELTAQRAVDGEAAADFTVSVTHALDALVDAGLAHRVNGELLAISRRGRDARQGVEPGAGNVLRVPDPGAVGGIEDANDPTDRLVGGAEIMPGGLG